MKFTEVKRGYDPVEVDDYIRTLDSVIKSYKEKDNAIKNAIISAQVAADNMIKNAKLQADEYKVQLVRELEHLRVAVERERSKIQDFQNTYSRLIRKYLVTLDEDDMSEINSCLDGINTMIDDLVDHDIAHIANSDNKAPEPEIKTPARQVFKVPDEVNEPDETVNEPDNNDQ